MKKTNNINNGKFLIAKGSKIKSVGILRKKNQEKWYVFNE